MRAAMLPRMARLSLTQRSQVVFAIASAAAMAAVLAGPWMQAERRAMDSQRAVWREAAIGWGRQPDAGDGSVRLISGKGEDAAGAIPSCLRPWRSSSATRNASTSIDSRRTRPRACCMRVHCVETR